MTFCRNVDCEYNSDERKEKDVKLGAGAAGHCEKSDIMLDVDGCCMSRSARKEEREV